MLITVIAYLALQSPISEPPPVVIDTRCQLTVHSGQFRGDFGFRADWSASNPFHWPGQAPEPRDSSFYDKVFKTRVMGDYTEAAEHFLENNSAVTIRAQEPQPFETTPEFFDHYVFYNALNPNQRPLHGALIEVLDATISVSLPPEGSSYRSMLKRQQLNRLKIISAW